MQNGKELKKQLEELIKQEKIIVGVEQGQTKLELVNIWENERQNVLQLLGLLYQKAILKSYNIKTRYSYNYSDIQTISFIQTYQNYDNTTTKTKYTFYNIPTSLGYIDIWKLAKIIEKGE